MDEKDYKTSEDLAKNESSIYEALKQGLDTAVELSNKENKED